MDVKFKFNDMNVQDETQQTLVKVLMLKGEPGDPGEGSDLTNYYDKTETDNKLSGKVDKETGKGLISALHGDWEPTIGWYKHLGSGYEYGDRGSGLDSEYIWREGDFYYVGDLCYVTFSIKIRFTSLLGSGFYIALGNFPDAGWSGYNGGQALTVSVLSKIDNNGDQLWTPTAGVVARVVPNKMFALITKGNGYTDIPWSDVEDTTNIFYLEGSGCYLRNYGVSVGDGEPTEYGLTSAPSTPQGEEEETTP